MTSKPRAHDNRVTTPLWLGDNCAGETGAGGGIAVRQAQMHACVQASKVALLRSLAGHPGAEELSPPPTGLVLLRASIGGRTGIQRGRSDGDAGHPGVPRPVR